MKEKNVVVLKGVSKSLKLFEESSKKRVTAFQGMLKLTSQTWGPSRESVQGCLKLLVETEKMHGSNLEKMAKLLDLVCATEPQE